MKRLFLGGLLLFAAIGSLKAQDCEALVLPRFGNNLELMYSYPEAKLFYWCKYAQYAFYESDTIPQGMDVYGIEEVVDRYTSQALPHDFVVDLNTFSVYAYNFMLIQSRYTNVDVDICFSTPASAHPYLILRSQVKAGQMAEADYYEKYFRDKE